MICLSLAELLALQDAAQTIMEHPNDREAAERCALRIFAWLERARARRERQVQAELMHNAEP